MKILAIFAHPDDESFGPAATLAKAYHQGHSIALLILTRGESGSLSRSTYLSAEKLAAQRSRELHHAARKIGIERVKLLDFPDNNLQNIPDASGTEAILQELNQIHPQYVITFHSNTISGHSDHRKVTDWTWQAVQSTACPSRLFYYGLTKQQTDMVPALKLLAMPKDEITHQVDVRDFIKDKIAAIRCHKTQLSFAEKLLNNTTFFEKFAARESFVQACPKPPKGPLKYDLWE